MDENKNPLKLFREFFEMGMFTFGGGWSIVAQMQKDYVDGKGELTAEELLQEMQQE